MDLASGLAEFLVVLGPMFESLLRSMVHGVEWSYVQEPFAGVPAPSKRLEDLEPLVEESAESIR